LKVDDVQLVVEWQRVQSVGKPPATCAGEVVPLKSDWWQPMQVVGRDPLYVVALVWHCTHCMVAWKPVNGNAVVLWLKVDDVQLVVEWQMVQSVGNPAATCAGLVVPV
jgi:hypothetical protein